ncbi:MAG: DUF5711 family protein [Natronincolaceae bacterium]|jgi:hypothetical protein|nr:DUF5711 family protein [Bacillota bacterium]
MKNRKKALWALIAIIVILFVASPGTIKYLKAKTNLDKGEISIVKEIETPHSSQIIYEKLDNGLVKYQGGILTLYNMAGEQLWSINLAINRPVIKTNSDSIYIIDENKNQILRINKKGEQVYKSALDKGYKNFSICDDNYMALHHDIEDPIRYVTVINEKGKKVSEIVLGEGEITNMAISKVCDRIAISVINTNKNSLENNVLTYDLKANLLGSESFGDNIILDIFYNEKGDLIVIDEKSISSISENNSTNWKTDFNDPIIITDIENKNFITVYSTGSNKGSIIYLPTENTIRVLSYDGKLLSEIKQGEEAINIDSCKNDIIVCSMRTVFKYSKNGNLKIEYPHTGDILKCFALSDDNIVIITKEKISFLSLKGK